MIKMIKRERDCLSNKSDLESLYAISNFPMYMGTTTQDISKDELLTMEYGISKGSGMIQLLNLVPLKLLYSEVHNTSTGNKWMEHHTEFAKFIKKYQPSRILEIGGANGILESIYNNTIKNPIEWTIVEPNPTPVNNCRAEFINKFFGDEYIPDVKYPFIVHSHLFEHLYYPMEFMNNIVKSLTHDGYMIFSIPNMKEYMKRNYTNAIMFEHSYYISEEYMEYILNQFQFTVIDKKYFYEEHSIFYAAKRNIYAKQKIEISQSWYSENKKLMMDFISWHKNIVLDLNTKLKLNSNKKVYLFGAHIFSQYLIALGLLTEPIIAILDNDANKQGKRLYGTDLHVESPKILNTKEDIVVILMAGSYSKEIRADILDNINNRVEFWE